MKLPKIILEGTKEEKDNLITHSCFMGVCLIVGIILIFVIILNLIFSMILIFIAIILVSIPFFRLKNCLRKSLGG